MSIRSLVRARRLAAPLRVLLFAAMIAVFGCGSTDDVSASASAIKPADKQTQGVRRHYVDSRFGQIHIRSVRPPISGKQKTPLFALHLSPNSGQVFTTFLPLIGTDRLVVAPDYPGYGMSDPIAGEQRIEDYAVAILDVIGATAENETVDLLGYHTGAGVALEIARQNPNRIRRLVLIGVPVLTAEERAAGAALPHIAFDEDGDFAREEWRRSWRWRGPGQPLESVLATYSAKMRPGVRERGAQAILAYDLIPVLEATKHSMMIIRVNDDLWEATARAKVMRPDAQYREFPDYGHGIFHAVPDDLNMVIREYLDAASPQM